MDDKGLDIKVVVQRFAQSTEALDKLGEKLSTLTSSSEAISKANQSVTEVTAQIRKIVDEFSRMTGTMRDASNKVENAATVASQFLAQTDLSSISRGLDSIQISLNGRISDLENQVEGLSEKLQSKDLELTQTKSELAGLKSRINAVPEKQRKKFGLS
jgi:predicted  nucleic acid-binding Zn-ribbon protein